MATKENQFQSLADAYSIPLYKYAYWLCGNRTTAEDLVQETFMRAWKALDSLRDEASAKSWLFRILRNENARRFEKLAPDHLNIEDVDPSGLATDCPEYNMERLALHRAIMKLKPEYREPLIMQILGGFSYDEIASALALENTTVVNRLYRAKQKLRESLETPSINRSTR